jgi:hypothetical protein
MEDVAMTVSEAMLPLPTSARPWPARQTGAAESRLLSGNPTIPGDDGDDLPVALVSAPPLIPRIYPGL